MVVSGFLEQNGNETDNSCYYFPAGGFLRGAHRDGSAGGDAGGSELRADEG